MIEIQHWTAWESAAALQMVVVSVDSGRRSANRNIIQNSLDQPRKTHCQISEAIGDAFSISPGVVFKIGKYGLPE
jgi:hypothetical protein